LYVFLIYRMFTTSPQYLYMCTSLMLCSIHVYLFYSSWDQEIVPKNCFFQPRNYSSRSPFDPCKTQWLLYRVSQEERSIFWEVIVSVILSKKVYMHMCPIPNGFRDRAI
jgi:hypothetical protein